jgi:hypothetical protein
MTGHSMGMGRCWCCSELVSRLIKGVPVLSSSEGGQQGLKVERVVQVVPVCVGGGGSAAAPSNASSSAYQ